MASSLETNIQDSIQQYHGLTSFQQFANSIVSTSITRTLFYPLEVAQIINQTNASETVDGILPTLVNLHKKFGIGGLYRGFWASSAIGWSISIGEVLGAAYMPTPVTRFFLRACITMAIFPLHIAKVRMITLPEKYEATLQTIQKIYEEEELPSLFRGLSVALLALVFRDAWALLLVKALTAFRVSPEITLKHVLISAALSSLLLELLQYPIDTAVKIVQSHPHDSDNVARVIANTGKIPRASGIMALFRGFGASFLKPFAIPFQVNVAATLYSVLFNKQPIIVIV